ncbi:hypothetical protein MTR_6g026980 [Medicago truncatula]|uniref:Uncharacterized protein n=1 Tax=Medicago truncatula TaxID=3880 RepID=G7KPI7_MEDTR|nr:hypothetical protein MTR_6g026980 [Medicago truncatula]
MFESICSTLQTESDPKPKESICSFTSADKKSARATAEGRIGSYIITLVDDIAMQVAECPQVHDRLIKVAFHIFLLFLQPTASKPYPTK